LDATRAIPAIMLRRKLLTLPQEFAAVRRFEAGQAPPERALTTTRLADDAKNLSGRKRQGHVP
jgi:hypothetical protein